MSSGERRRSARIVELEARKAEQAKTQNKDNGTSAKATEQDLDTKPDSHQSQERKKIKTRPVQDLVGDTTMIYQVQKARLSLGVDHLVNSDQVAMPSKITVPEKSKLQLLLSTLQRRDSRNFFAEPVDPVEVEDYYDVIEEPIDFGTIAKKLNEGSYTTPEEFEHDVFLVFDNAMLFNAPTTIYYRQARTIKEVAKRLFDTLKTNPHNFEVECSKRREGPGRRSKDEVRTVNYNAYNRRISHKDERCFEEEQCDTYRPWDLNENGSLVSMVYNSPQELIRVDGANIDYTRRLLKFAEDLGPTAQMVARRKIESFIEASKIQNASIYNQLLPTRNQTANLAFTPKGGIAQGVFAGLVEPNGGFRGKQIEAGSSNVQLQSLQNPIFSPAYTQRGITVSPSLVIPRNPTGEREGIHSSINSLKAWDASSGGTSLGGCLAGSTRVMKGKEIAEGIGAEIEMGTAHRNKANRNAVDKTFDFLAAWNRKNDSKEYGFPNMQQDVVNPIQTARAVSSDSAMPLFAPTIDTSVSSWWWPSEARTGQTSRNHAIVNKPMQGIDSHYLNGAHQTQGMIDGNCPSYARNMQQGGQVSNWFKPVELEPRPVIGNLFQLPLRSVEGGSSRGARPLERRNWMEDLLRKQNQ